MSSSSGSPCTFCIMIFAMFFWLGKSLRHVTIAAWLPPHLMVGLSLFVVLAGSVEMGIDSLSAK